MQERQIIEKNDEAKQRYFLLKKKVNIKQKVINLSQNAGNQTTIRRQKSCIALVSNLVFRLGWAMWATTLGRLETSNGFNNLR